jgi:hypothetical protein
MHSVFYSNQGLVSIIMVSGDRKLTISAGVSIFFLAQFVDMAHTKSKCPFSAGA